MHDLRLVGVHDDGEHLLLAGADGEQYLLAVDEPLRAAVRRDRAHLGQLQIEMSGDLRPREVQVRIRAGATAEEVAERSGWPLERVRRYEGAVLAEREHIAELARKVTLRRRGSDATPPTLAYRVEQRLAARGADPQLTWDSARAEDGPWILTLRFTAGGREREARWLYDAAARTVTPQDDEALWLSEDEQPPAAPVPAPHLAAVPTINAAPAGPLEPTELYDLEADTGIEAPETVTLEAPSAVDLVGAMRQRRHGRRRQPPAIELPLEPMTFDPTLLGDPPPAHPFPFPDRLREQPTESAERDGDSEPEASGADVPSDTADRGPVPPQNRSGSRPQTPQTPRGFAPPQLAGVRSRPAPPAPVEEAPVHRRARRASVPSWDEIMFGGKRD